MAWKKKYFFKFNALNNDLYEVYFEFQDFAGIPVELQGAGQPVVLSCTSGDENKFQPILGAECKIQIKVRREDNISIKDFIVETDDEIRVSIYKNYNYTYPVFQGFLAVDDYSQPLLDKPYIISLRALDQLGLLKGVDLTDTNGNLFGSSVCSDINLNIVQWLAQILYKTGLIFPIRVYFSFYNQSMSDIVDPLYFTYLSSQTFTKASTFDVNASNDPAIDVNAQAVDDCYTALEKITRCFRAKLFYQNGAWHFINLYEWAKADGFTYREYSMGDPASGMVPVTQTNAAFSKKFDINIGKREIINPVVSNQIITYKRPTKWVQLNYDYNQAQNKIRNQELNEGDPDPTHDETISSSIIDTTIKPTVDLLTRAFVANCFSHKNGPVGSPVDPTEPGFIRKVYDTLGYEMVRYLVLKEAAEITFFITTPILVDAGDKFSMSVDFRTRNSTGTQTNQPVAYVQFTGIDGTTWYLDSYDSAETSHPTRWVQNTVFFVGHNFPTDTNTWETVSCGQTLPVVPGSGSIKIFLASNVVGAGEYWFKNISVTVYPFLNGSYTQLKGDYNFAGQAANIKQTDEQSVEISDSPKRYFLAALLKANSDLLPPSWRLRGEVLGVGQRGKRFSQYMAELIYFNENRTIQKIEGDFKGINYINNVDRIEYPPIGFLNSYYFVDTEDPTKRYMLTSYSNKDLNTGEFSGVFVEVMKDVNDSFQFFDETSTDPKYVFNYKF